MLFLSMHIIYNFDKNRDVMAIKICTFNNVTLVLYWIGNAQCRTGKLNHWLTVNIGKCIVIIYHNVHFTQNPF